jgi:ABC-2 type transport system permease protein
MSPASLARYAWVARTAARQQWIYRAELVARGLQMVIFMLVFMALWTTAFGVSGQAELQGFTRVELVWYLAMTETITLSTSRIFEEIGEAVRAGDLAYTLGRPLSYPFFQVANSLGNSAPRFLLNLLIAAAVVGLGLRQAAGSPAGLAAFLGMALLALALDACIAVLIGLLAFWLEEIAPIFWVYQKLVFTLGGMFLPLDMFPTWLRDVARWLPFQFITYVPARAFLDFEPRFVLQAAAGQVAYIAAMGALLALVWRRARRRLVVHGG